MTAAAALLCKSNHHRIGRPLCLENPRPKGGMLIHGKLCPPGPPTAPLTATEYSRCGSHWPRQSGSLSRRR
jgi:hypothetical protein